MDTLAIRGMVLAIKEMGGTLVKVNSTHLFFDVIEGSEIDDSKKLERFRDVLNEISGLGIKIKRVLK